VDGGAKSGVADLFRTPAIRRISLILYVVWFSTYLVYYGLVLNLNNLGGDVYVNSVISGEQTSNRQNFVGKNDLRD
jgi:hypothetical protein